MSKQESAMNMINDSIKSEAATSFERAYEINSHTIEVVKAAIASGAVGADKVGDLIRSVHNAFAETYAAAGGIASATEALASSVAASLMAPVTAVEIASLIDDEAVAEAAPVDEPVKLVSIYENPYDAVQDELVHCLIDGVGKKMLKRYVHAKYNLKWEEYLAAFDLPSDYPSVAPKYSASKKAEALALGLGSTVPKTPRALRAVEDTSAQTPRTTSERRRRNRDPQKSGTMTASRAAA
jgi:predicted transcriptional regulator